ncbi:putative uncharacterized protein [Candidatus Colimorpha enterica]|uniref:Uncharacterized protein n=1 Tax=Candidatus Colimorpha enterica TaxID=3083063 RepID=R6TV71_9BACT|nr:putative uncharacterized protein [Candidatus Colimorpha enterica]
MNNINAKKRSLKLGGYSVIVTAVVIAIVIVVNLAVRLLPTKYTKYSTSTVGLYDISETSRGILSKVKDKISIYVVSDPSYTDEVTREYVAKYAGLNSNISWSTVDPAVKPGFLKEYTSESLSSQQTHLVLVNKNNGRSRVIPYTDIYYQKYTQQELLYYQMYYGSVPDNPTYFNIEQQLTSAVDYLTAEKLPTVYYITGHGETALDSTVTGLIGAENIDLAELPLLTKGSVPDDADAVIINAATKDFTEDEIKALEAYTAKGGNVLMTSFYNSKLKERNLTNLYGFAKSLGLEYKDVKVYEGGGKFVQSPDNILPTLVDKKYSSAIGNNTYLLMVQCNAITLAKTAPEGVTLTELLTTSVLGFAKTEVTEETKSEKEEGDEEGTFVLGAMAEKTVDGKTSKLVWLASPVLLDGRSLSYYSNISYFMAILTDLCEKESSVTINAKSLQIEALTVSEASANLWGIILIAVIPLAVLVTGFVIWNRRIKR